MAASPDTEGDAAFLDLSSSAMDNKTFRKTLSERTGRTSKDLDALIGALRHLLVENAIEQRTLAIPGFGCFVPVKHDEQIITDLTTGRRMLLPPELALEYFPGSTMRKRIDPSAQPRETPDTVGGLMTLPSASAAIAGMSAIGHDGAENFLKAFFSIVEEGVAGNGEVTVKGIGEFHGLSFKPDPTLAQDANQPFAMFEPVELEAQESDLMNTEDTAESVAAQEETASNRAEPELKIVSEEGKPEEEEEQEKTDFTEKTAPMEESTERTMADTTALDAGSGDSRRMSGRILAVGAGAVILALVAGFVCGRLTAPAKTTETIKTDTVRVVVRDTVVMAAPPTPAVTKTPDPIYDTVTSDRYLASMSRQYYGRMEYWVYIYKANEKKLGDPDRIKPGTRVEIPPFERYAVSPDDSVNLAAARRMSKEIYSRYGK